MSETLRLGSWAAQLCRVLADGMRFEPDGVSPACWLLAAMAAAAMQQHCCAAICSTPQGNQQGSWLCRRGFGVPCETRC